VVGPSISTSARSTWCASRVSACRTRSAKKETPRHAAHGEHQRGARARAARPRAQSRTSIRRARRRTALALAVDAAGDEPDLAGAAGGDRVVVVTSTSVVRASAFISNMRSITPAPVAASRFPVGSSAKEELRLGDEGARERHALLLAARRSVLGVMPQPFGEAHAREHFRRAVRRARFRPRAPAAASRSPARSAPAAAGTTGTRSRGAAPAVPHARLRPVRRDPCRPGARRLSSAYRGPRAGREASICPTPRHRRWPPPRPA